MQLLRVVGIELFNLLPTTYGRVNGEILHPKNRRSGRGCGIIIPHDFVNLLCQPACVAVWLCRWGKTKVYYYIVCGMLDKTLSDSSQKVPLEPVVFRILNKAICQLHATDKPGFAGCDFAHARQNTAKIRDNSGLFLALPRRLRGVACKPGAIRLYCKMAKKRQRGAETRRHGGSIYDYIISLYTQNRDHFLCMGDRL